MNAVVECARGQCDLFAYAEDFGPIHGDLGSKFLIVTVADLGLPRNKQTEHGTVVAGMPGAFVARNLAVLVNVDIFTEVVGVSGALIDSEIVPRYLNHLAVL